MDLHRELMNLHTELGKPTKKIPVKVKVQVVEACSLVVHHVPDECLIDTFKGMQSTETLTPIRAKVLHEIKSYARDNNNFGETRRMVEHMMRAEKFLSIPTRSLMAAPIKEALRLVGKASS